MRRTTFWLLATLALLAPAAAHAVEVLVLTTTTVVTSSADYAVRIQNNGPRDITCKVGAVTALGRGTVVKANGGWWNPSNVAGASFQCLAPVAQVTGAATEVTNGVAGGGGGYQPAADAQWVTTLVTATTLTQLVAAPAAGLSIYVTDLGCSSSAATTATADQQCAFKIGTGTNCATGTTYLWATFLPALGAQVANFTSPRKLPAASALCFHNAVAGTKTFDVTYYVAP